MHFVFLDYIIMAGYVALMVGVAILAKRKEQNSLTDYFTGGKNLPWWLIGVSMVATTFAADTPLAITGLVSTQGIAGNWFWWNWMISGVITVFLYTKLWKRADVITDVEFIELRYGGKTASFLRGFRALYFAFPFNCVIMGWVTVGMAKVLSVTTGADQWLVITILYALIAIYIAISGLWGVVVTDFVQFFIAMLGTIALAWFAVKDVGGLHVLHQKVVSSVSFDVFSFNPFTDPKIAFSTAFVWIGMAWWAAWYPGAEPGGGGYIAQRMFSAKDEKNAVGGTLLFNVLNYAARPWPWILVALVAMVTYPNLADPEAGYPLIMNKVLPAGWYGLLIVAFLSAFVSTISTQLNWGTSYVVNDFYKRFIRPEDDFESKKIAQKHYVWVSQIATIAMAGIAIIISYLFTSVKGGWEYILSLSAGIGGVLLLRWFWWRINAWSEIVAMFAAAIGSIIAPYLGYADFADKIIFTTIFSTICWVIATFITAPETDATLQHFVDKVRPGGPGWKQFRHQGASAESLWPAFIQIVLSVAAILGFIYGMGQLFFGSVFLGSTLIVLSTIILIFITRSVTRITT